MVLDYSDQMMEPSKEPFLLGLSPQYFSLVVKGIKTVEGRVFKPKFQQLKPLDPLRFYLSDDPEKFRDGVVTHLHRYATFFEMLEKEGIENCLPGKTSFQEGASIYHHFPGYKEGEATYGVLAIRFILS